jgi:hypothetical protein
MSFATLDLDFDSTTVGRFKISSSDLDVFFLLLLDLDCCTKLSRATTTTIITVYCTVGTGLDDK